MAFWSLEDSQNPCKTLKTGPSSPCAVLPCMCILRPPRSACTGPPPSPDTAPSLRTGPSAPYILPSPSCQILLTPQVADCTLPKRSLLMPPHKPGEHPHRLTLATLPSTALSTPIPSVSARLEAWGQDPSLSYSRLYPAMLCTFLLNEWMSTEA